MSLLDTLRVLLAAHYAREHERRLLDAIGAARTEAEFAVAWCRWYFDEEAVP